MSRRWASFRSVTVIMTFAVTFAAPFIHSGSFCRRVASSAKKASEKNWTMGSHPSDGPRLDNPFQPDARLGRIIEFRPLRRARVGSQARSTARDSRSFPAGVPRFESWPTHQNSCLVCGRVQDGLIPSERYVGPWHGMARFLESDRRC